MRLKHPKGTCRKCPRESMAYGGRLCLKCYHGRKYRTHREYRFRQRLATGDAHAREWIRHAAELCEILGCEPDLFWAYRQHLRRRTKLKTQLDKRISENLERYHAQSSMQALQQRRDEAGVVSDAPLPDHARDTDRQAERQVLTA